MHCNRSIQLSPALLICLLSFGCGDEQKNKKDRNRSSNSSLIVNGTGADNGQSVDPRRGRGAGNGATTNSAANDGKAQKADFYEGADDNPAMVRAFFEARARIKGFVAALKKPKKTYGRFALKVRLTKNKVSEDIWLSDPVDHGPYMTGNLNNVPKLVKGFEPGVEVQVYKDDLLDWMYTDDDVLVGGFTIRVLLDNKSPQERAEYEKSLPWRITKRRR